ncbi:MAG: hypothetical protein CM15mP98_06480 [Paracoccaceae bacterium]|nr:MAG: hypothetical protein CM15mP98_06480 [Paracoccaceae bacterium]
MGLDALSVEKRLLSLFFDQFLGVYHVHSPKTLVFTPQKGYIQLWVKFLVAAA